MPSSQRLNGILWGWGETDSWKKPEAKNLVTLSLQAVDCSTVVSANKEMSSILAVYKPKCRQNFPTGLFYREAEKCFGICMFFHGPSELVGDSFVCWKGDEFGTPLQLLVYDRILRTCAVCTVQCAVHLLNPTTAQWQVTHFNKR